MWGEVQQKLSRWSDQEFASYAIKEGWSSYIHLAITFLMFSAWQISNKFPLEPSCWWMGVCGLYAPGYIYLFIYFMLCFSARIISQCGLMIQIQTIYHFKKAPCRTVIKVAEFCSWIERAVLEKWHLSVVDALGLTDNWLKEGVSIPNPHVHSIYPANLATEAISDALSAFFSENS